MKIDIMFLVSQYRNIDAAYSLLPWRGGATLFCFTRCKCWHDGVIYNITNDFFLAIKIIVKATLKIQSFTLKLHYRKL